MYPACNEHAPYCHLWPVRLYIIFPPYLINDVDFREKSQWTWNVTSWLSLRLLSENFLTLNRTEWDMIKNVYWTACKVPVIFVAFNEIRLFSQKIFEKKKLKISLKSVSGSPVVPRGRTDRQTDRQTDITKLTVAFRNSANATENRRQSTNCRPVAIIQTSDACQRLISPSTLAPPYPKIPFLFLAVQLNTEGRRWQKVGGGEQLRTNSDKLVGNLGEARNNTCYCSDRY